jgi:Lon-like protease
MALVLVLLVTGEFIWLPDPLRFGESMYWIDIVDLLVYALALIPLIWVMSSLLNIFKLSRESSKSRSRVICRQLRSGAVCITGAIAIVIILTIPKELQLSVSSLAIVWILVFVDLFFLEHNRRKVPIRSISVFMLTICLLICLFWPTGYMVTYPGLTLNMNRYAQVSGGIRHGEISGVLVFERPAFPIDWVSAKLFSHYTFVVKPPDLSLGEYNQQVLMMKADANAAGSAIAFQKLGKGKGITSHGVRITGVVKNSPVEEILKPGDVIEEVNGQAVTTVNDLTARMIQVKPGDQVELTLLRGDKRVIIKAGTRANPNEPNRAAFGIQISNELQYDIPGNVVFHNYLLHEGGPSHGAMLALTLMDQLTPNGITNGNKVAGTGTIEPDGSVGPVGALEQKGYTVSRTDADVFFVPYQNEAEARKGASSLQIVPVHTLDDILNWLQAHPAKQL